MKLIGCLSVTLIAGSAFAQLHSFGIAGYWDTPDTVMDTGPGPFTNENVSAIESTVASGLRITTTGYQTSALPSHTLSYGMGSTYGQYAYLSFEVGPSPIVVTGLRVHGSSRWTVSGGFGVEPWSTVEAEAQLVAYEELNGIPGFQNSGGDMSGALLLEVGWGGWTPQYGAGSWENSIDDVSPTYQVLPAGGLYFIVYLVFGYGFVAPGYPDVIMEHRYGGPGDPGHEGYMLDLEYNVVPEPASAWALGIGLIAFRRRRCASRLR